MEYVTKHTVKLDDQVLSPGTVVEIKDRRLANRLQEQGAIEEQRLTPSEAKRVVAREAQERAETKTKGAAGGGDTTQGTEKKS